MKDRADYILNQLEEHGSVRVAELSEQLGCSEVTIRSDIQKMDEKGLLIRTHGGARKVEAQLLVSFEAGSVLKNKEQKIRIAQKAASYISDGDTIILDDSSVNYYLAQIIKDDGSKHIIVITNNLPAAGILSGKSHIDLFLVGGQVGGKFAATMGEITCNSLANFHADKAFISAHGINFDAGITSIGSAQMYVKKAILKASKEIYVLVDSSKFDGGYILVVCPLDEIDKIITDNGLGEEHRKSADEKKVSIDIV